MGRLDGKVAVVTGGSQGMGASHARKMAEEGATVVITDIIEEAGKKVAEEIGGNAFFMKLNVAKEDEWKSTASEIVRRFGKIDILVNNAGIGIFKRIDEITSNEFEKTMMINAFSVFYSLKAVVPFMKEKGGSIINISSIDGVIGEIGSIGYGASKFAVTGMTKCAALELAQYGIRVNSVHPGAVDTAMGAEGSEAAGLGENPYVSVPMKRAARPEEISNLVVFLASEESSYITGSEVIIDGGKICGTTW